MENIDPLYFLQPIITIAFSVGLVIYWHYRRSFTRAAFRYSVLAYTGAILTKILVQALTYNSFQALFGDNALAQGFYFGVQTVLFEVGGAFLVAAWAVSRNKLSGKDAEGYGLGLAFWENAGLIGALGLVNLTTTYVALSSGGPASPLYSDLITSRPDLFYPPLQALPVIAYGLLERVTSLVFHFCWGYLCLLAAFLHNRRYLLLALPMGLVDFSVPFASSVGIALFESLLFAVGIGTLALTLLVTKYWHKQDHGL